MFLKLQQQLDISFRQAHQHGIPGFIDLFIFQRHIAHTAYFVPERLGIDPARFHFPEQLILGQMTEILPDPRQSQFLKRTGRELMFDLKNNSPEIENNILYRVCCHCFFTVKFVKLPLFSNPQPIARAENGPIAQSVRATDS